VRALAAGQIRPYAAFVLLEYTGTDPSAAVPAIGTFLRSRANRAHGDVTEVAEGISGIGAPEELIGAAATPIQVEIDGFAYRVEGPPPWGHDDLGLANVRHELVVLVRWGWLLAIHAEDRIRRALIDWTRGAAVPPFRAVRPASMSRFGCGGRRDPERRVCGTPQGSGLQMPVLREAVQGSHRGNVCQRVSSGADLPPVWRVGAP